MIKRPRSAVGKLPAMGADDGRPKSRLGKVGLQRPSTVSSRLRAQGDERRVKMGRPKIKRAAETLRQRNQEKLAELKELETEHVVDAVGATAAKEVPNLLFERPIEVDPHREGQLSARGVHHRSEAFFKSQISKMSTLIRQGKTENLKSKHVRDNLASLYFNRAYAYERLGATNPAMRDYTQCLTYNGSFSEAHFNRSGLHFSLGDVSKAIRDLDAAISIEPSNRLYFENRYRLRRKSNWYMESAGDLVVKRRLEDRLAGRTVYTEEELEEMERQKAEEKRLKAEQADSDDDTEDEEEEDHGPETPPHLLVPPGERTKRDLRLWRETIMEVPYFKFLEHEPDLLQMLGQVMCLSEFKAGTYVFKKGDIGTNFMTVFEGEVHVTITIPAPGGGFQEKLLKRLHKNDTFGETALLNVGGKRTAHIYAEQHSKLLTIDCDPFLQIQTIYNNHQREEKMDVFNQCLAFRSWKKEQLHMLCDKLSVKSYEVGQVVVEQGHKLSELYLLKSGVVKVLKAVPPKLAVDFISKNEELALGHRVKPGTPGGGAANGGQDHGDGVEEPTPSTGVTSVDTTPAASQGGTPGVSRGGSRRGSKSSRGGEDDPQEDPQQQKGTVHDEYSLGEWSESSSSLLERSMAAPPHQYKAPEMKMAYTLKTPGLWVTQRNWKDNLYTEGLTPSEDDEKDRSMELLVGVLGASEIFGEIAVLDAERPSPVTVVAYTNIECYCITIDLLRDPKIEAQYNVPMLQHLNRSMMMNNPHPAKLAHFYGDRFLWDKQKAVVLKELMPESWTRAHEQLLLKQKRDIIENREEERDLLDVTGAHHTADIFIENGHKIKHRANKLPERRRDEKTALYRQAAEKYKQAISIDESNIVAIYNLAFTHFKIGLHEAALELCERCLAIDPTGRAGHKGDKLGHPKPGTVHFLTAQIFADMERFDSCIDALAKAIHMEETYTEGGGKVVGGHKHIVASPYIVEATRVEAQLKIKLVEATESSIIVFRRALDRIGAITGTKKKTGRRGGKLNDAKMQYHASVVHSDKIHSEANEKLKKIAVGE